MIVFQTVVSLMSGDFDLAELGVFFAASAEFSAEFLSSDFALESVVEELAILGSSGSCTCSVGNWRKEGTSSCSLVRRPR